MLDRPPLAIAHDAPPPGILMTDALLVARAQRDPAAFSPLYEAYFDPVYRYCYHRLGSWEAAEDATSVIFTNALAALPRYRAGGGARKDEGPPCTRQSPLTLAAFRPWGSSARCRHAGGCAGV